MPNFGIELHLQSPTTSHIMKTWLRPPFESGRCSQQFYRNASRWSMRNCASEDVQAVAGPHCKLDLTYLGRLEGVVGRDDDVNYESSLRVARIRLDTLQKVGRNQSQRVRVAEALADNIQSPPFACLNACKFRTCRLRRARSRGCSPRRVLTGPKMVPFQCLRSSPTIFAWTVFCP